METKRTVEWMTSKGKAVYMVELQLEKEINLDGDKDTVPCCEILSYCEVEGVGSVSAYIRELDDPIEMSGKTAIAVIGGKVGLEAATLAQIKGALAAIEAHPVYVARQEKRAANKREIEELEKTRRANGYCPKCESYCDGNCEAN